MPSLRQCVLFLVGLGALMAAWAVAAEPYPFKTRPREVEKEEWLRVDFESGLPQGATLGDNAKLTEKVGSANSQALVSSGKGSIIKIPIARTDVDISRFDLSIDYGGEGFAYFTAKINAYNRSGKLLRSVSAGGEWGFSPGMRPWELRTVDLEFEDIYAVELELEQTTDVGTMRIDNIVLRRHDLPAILGRSARKNLTTQLRLEGIKVEDVGDLWVGSTPERQSYFDFARIDENKRYVHSEWQSRLHAGTTYKETRGRTPTFMLGVSARQAALEAAAAQQGKTLVQMYEVLLDDVKDHGFNCVWVDFTKDLEAFDKLAHARGISTIIRDPSWSGLEKWVAKPKDPIPAEFKTTAAANLKKYGAMKSLLGYHMNRPLGAGHQPMLAEARKYLASVAPKVQLIDEQSDIYGAEAIAEPVPHLGIQYGGFHHYVGRPWAPPSYMYHPNYWPKALSEGWYRRIHDGFRVQFVPTLWSVPTGRQYGKNSIDMQQDRVETAKNGWVYNEEAKRWSGWYRYDFPPGLLRAVVWKAIEAGAEGVLFEEWGPAAVPHDLSGVDLLADSKYANGNYQPETLRRADGSESPGWEELGEVGRELAVYRDLFADTTQHGHNNSRANNADVRVRTLTGRSDPFKMLVVVNTKLGQYDEASLKIDPATGALQNYEPAEPVQFELTVEKDYGLVDMTTGKTIEPKSTSIKDKSAKYDLSLLPGEGRLLYRGKLAQFQRFAQKYKIPISSSTRTRSTAGR